MNFNKFINQTITNSRGEQGVITSINDEHVIVRYGENDKKYQTKICFQSFLKFDDDKLQQEISKFIEEINQMEKDKNQSIIKASDDAINYQKQLFEELEKYNTKEWYFHHFFGPEYEYKPKKQYKEVKHGYHYWELYQAYYV